MSTAVGPFTVSDVSLENLGYTITRKTYFLGGVSASSTTAIATRISGDPDPANNGLHYLYSDHLGSIGAVTNSSGALLDMTRFLPFGNYRGAAPTQTITDRDFTGQPENRELGLLYYQARFYVPGVGRFASADTLIPNPTNPQSWNRYSYVNNQPLVFSDPTGHWLESAWDALNVGMGIVSFVDNVKQGNYGWAAVDAIGVVVDAAALVTPIVPGGIGAILKGSRAVDTAVDAIQTVNQVSNAAQTANQAANVVQGAQAAARYADEAIQATTSGTRQTVNNAPWPVRADCSFSGDTMVTTTTGYQAIETISIGDYVLAYHEVEGSLDYYPVLAVWAHEDTVIIELVIGGEVIFTTPDHPFYTEQGDWLPAAALQVGDEIRQADWDSGTVETITFIASPQTMYNFTVATAHTYFVGEGQWLVHNACRPFDVGPANVLQFRSIGDGLDVHHVPQKHPAAQVIPGYDHRTAPSIAIPEAMHSAIPSSRGAYHGTARDLLANDLWNLRKEGVPNSALRDLLDLNKTTYPGVFD